MHKRKLVFGQNVYTINIFALQHVKINQVLCQKRINEKREKKKRTNNAPLYCLCYYISAFMLFYSFNL